MAETRLKSSPKKKVEKKSKSSHKKVEKKPKSSPTKVGKSEKNTKTKNTKTTKTKNTKTKNTKTRDGKLKKDTVSHKHNKSQEPPIESTTDDIEKTDKSKNIDEMNNIEEIENNIIEIENNIKEIENNIEDNIEEIDDQSITTNGVQLCCPYLDTIKRAVLDFDFEKLCSVSLTHLNVYACLVCGKYFQGRHKNSHAYVHSVEYGHYVWINLESLKFYCLPDNYEIVDSSLDDIKRQVKPHFDRDYIRALDKPNVEHQKTLRCLDGSTYHPGVLGMNNIKETDYMNVVLQSLTFVKPFRNYFLIDKNYVDIRRPSSDNLYTLLTRFGELTHKLWNNINFRSHISPHEMVQAVVLASKKRFNLEKQSDPIQFLAWLLNNLHQSLNWNNQDKNSIVYKTFRGKIKVSIRQIKINELGELEDDDAIARPNETITQIQPFLFVPLEIPPPPLFKDEVEGNVIAQISLYELLEKYNGVKEHITPTYEIKRFSFVKLPKYLIFCLKRFSYNYFFTERNPTIVNFNINCLDMTEYIDPEALNNNAPKSTIYRLIANIVISQESMLDGADKPAYLLQIYHKSLDKWFEIQDLHIKEIMPQMITISESYIQIWEQQQL